MLTDLKLLKDILVRVAELFMAEKGIKVDYKFGTMIEIPHYGTQLNEIAEYQNSSHSFTMA